MPDIVIHDLLDFPQWLPVISAWFQDEWRGLFQEEVRAEFETAIGLRQRDRLPAALIAMNGDQVVGTVTLRDQLLDYAPGVPVISALYVVPQYRRQGVATRLLRAAEHRARELGITRLCLFTQAPHAFYGAYGWTRYDEMGPPTLKMTVMEKWLTPQRLFQPPPLARRG